MVSALRARPLLTGGHPLPPVAPGTARLHARVRVVCSVRWRREVHGVRGIDLERCVPRLRLTNDRLVGAAGLRAVGDAAALVRNRRGGLAWYTAPGPDPAPRITPAGTLVIVVVSWIDGGGSEWVLARWYELGRAEFGVFAARDLERLRFPRREKR